MQDIDFNRTDFGVIKINGEDMQEEVFKKVRFPLEEQLDELGFVYGMRLRGYSLGTQPMKNLLVVGEGKREYYNLLAYSRKLTKNQIEDYELDYLGVYNYTNDTWHPLKKL